MHRTAFLILQCLAIAAMAGAVYLLCVWVVWDYRNLQDDIAKRNNQYTTWFSVLYFTKQDLFMPFEFLLFALFFNRLRTCTRRSTENGS